jgi:thiamine-monophosphate kinase
LRANQATFNWSLLGGDTVRTPGPLTISVTAFGTIPHAKALRRGGAQIGDEVWVTGWIGDGALGLAIAKGHDLGLPSEIAAAAEQKFRLPQPRIAFGVALAESSLATASADISDGLIADLGHIASASALGMAIEAASVPLSDAGRLVTGRDPDWLPRLLTGGDDYEVIFTAPPFAAQQVVAMAEATQTPLCRIGHTTAGTEVIVTLPNGDALPLLSRGYTHF